MKVQVLDVARQEFDEAVQYFEQRKAGLGEEFRDAIRAQLLKIRAHPDAWPLIRPGIRKCLGSRFPYDVVYQKHGTQILILALAHKKRRPLYWSDRLP